MEQQNGRQWTPDEIEASASAIYDTTLDAIEGMPPAVPYQVGAWLISAVVGKLVAKGHHAEAADILVGLIEDGRNMLSAIVNQAEAANGAQEKAG